MKRLILIVAMTLIAALAAACGGGDGGSSGGGGAGNPEDAGREFLNAAFSMDVEKARSIVCEARRGEIEEPSDEDRAALEAVEIDLSGLEFTVSDQTDNSAMLTVSGNVTMSMEGQEMELPVDQMFGDEAIPVIVENGKWVVCPENTDLLGG
ncbi:MAG: hypothetical protein CUN56_03115 [Phototrophicales bacterium]|nr:MAG: hypothetical protein CUN56_03115 [Phototrophicales bacterium]